MYTTAVLKEYHHKVLQKQKNYIQTRVAEIIFKHGSCIDFAGENNVSHDILYLVL